MLITGRGNVQNGFDALSRQRRRCGGRTGGSHRALDPDQQMRDASSAVERSKRTLALAIAQDQQEGRRLDTTNTRIADLELRATAALDGGREDLAREAAQQIAHLEADRDAAMTARTLFASEIARL